MRSQHATLGDLRALFAERHAEIRAYHQERGGGLQVVTALSDLADHLLLRGLRTLDPKMTANWGGTLVALGGYGRREIAPASDIDLMFLCSEDGHKAAQAVASALLCLLWDVGYKVGHSLRTVADCVAVARPDPIITTSMLEARFLAGDATRFAQFQRAFSAHVAQNLKPFLAHLRAARTAQEGISLLEPNVKQSPGALRDVHHIQWAALARYQTGAPAHLHQRGLLSDHEYAALSTTQDFLWRIRNQMHFQFGASDHLTIEIQDDLAPFMGFENRQALMRHYAIQTARVLETSRRFLRQVIPVSRWERWRARWRTQTVTPGIRLSAGELSAAIETLGNDEAILRLFLARKKHAARIADDNLAAIRRHAETGAPLSPAGVALFRTLMATPGGIADTLRLMHQTRFLWKIIPEFAHVAYLSPESRSHAFTVDEHSFRAVHEAEALWVGTGPISDIYRALGRLDLLHLALLLHDVGKGLAGNHGEEGEKIAEAVAARLGYTGEEMALLRFLVRRHLIFSDVALYRDFSNEPVLLQFAREVSQPETLRHLFVLTCADTRAVGPGIWTEWKGDLLLKLYNETLTLLAGAPTSLEEKIEAVRARLHEEVCGQYPEIWLAQTLPALASRYLASTPHEKMWVDLAALFRLATHPIQVSGTPLAQPGMVEYTLYARDDVTPGLCSKMTGVLAARGMQIFAAQVTTHADGTVVDTFQVYDADAAEGSVASDRLAALERDVQNVFRGVETVENLIVKYRRFSPPGLRPLALPVRVAVDNDSSHRFTVIDVFASDQQGLLYRIAKTLFELGLSVHSAIIATRLDQIVDVFYVSDAHGQKITHPDEIAQIKARLIAQIENP